MQDTKIKNNGWLDPKEFPLVIWREAEGDELDPELDAGDLVGEFTPNGKGEFIAAIWVLSPEGDYWSTLKCRLNDEDAALEEFDGLEFVPCAWDRDDIDFYFPIPELPPLSSLSTTS